MHQLDYDTECHIFLQIFWVYLWNCFAFCFCLRITFKSLDYVKCITPISVAFISSLEALNRLHKRELWSSDLWTGTCFYNSPLWLISQLALLYFNFKFRQNTHSHLVSYRCRSWNLFYNIAWINSWFYWL